MNFLEKVKKRMEIVSNVLTIGLDTDYERLPSRFSKNAEGVYEFNREIIERTKNFACAYKINSAFYEQLGPDGMKTMMKTRDLIGDLPVIYDAKRSDIDSTAKAYARAAFEFFGFDAITVLPYMGSDSMEVFFSYTDKYTFVLSLSSNQGAFDFEYHGTPPLYLKVAKFVSEKNKRYGNCGLVVGATFAEKIREIHEIANESLILVPGVGAQGGDVQKVMNSIDGRNLLVNVSRSIIFSADPEKSSYDYSKLLSLR
ncbi:orotidine-5'-phosphate decarboxylase [Athalassotoga saccharophila]|uniref:orotidine-5'-phosphate decarboxylase n=1 Tax=Athalassotoga saccharophila TaxID=1441386 RepID=UPI00137A1202|nr:orotidine-5'-phosphate decarboxylase [Athalassotoga saccharophila]BBJ27327.1 orotidine 5'-phosphate decarboxylase [Athalassotoga saccharophila]